MADWLKIKIDHEVVWHKTTEFEVDAAAVREYFELADDTEITEEQLREYVEGDLDCGEPVGWLPNEEYGEGYDWVRADVNAVTYAEERLKGRLVEPVEPDPQYV